MVSASRFLILVLGLCIAGHEGFTFQLKSDVLSSGGTKITSADYAIEGTLAQFTASSPWLMCSGYRAVIGFWHPLSGGPGVQEKFEHIVLAGYTNYLYPNVPNPFFGHTTFQYSIANEGQVALDLYNTLGQRVVSLVNAKQVPGIYRISWNVDEENFPTGVYFCRLKTPDYSRVRKIVVIH
jgi:hypothetical protein